jgi:hypothetical protein
MADELLLTRNEKGNDLVMFIDGHDQECCIEMTQRAESIWLGPTDPAMTVYEMPDRTGKTLEIQVPFGFKIHAQMHLSREQVSQLLPFLTNFVERGKLL